MCGEMIDDCQSLSSGWQRERERENERESDFPRHRILHTSVCWRATRAEALILSDATEKRRTLSSLSLPVPGTSALSVDGPSFFHPPTRAGHGGEGRQKKKRERERKRRICSSSADGTNEVVLVDVVAEAKAKAEAASFLPPSLARCHEKGIRVPTERSESLVVEKGEKKGAFSASSLQPR